MQRGGGMAIGNVPKIKSRNPAAEYDKTVQKENVDQHQNYSI